MSRYDMPNSNDLERKRVNQLDSVGDIQDGDVLVGERVNGTTVRITYQAPTEVTDGDKGDITVSSSGSVWTVDNEAITYAKIQNVSDTDKLLGRSSSGAGNIEEISCTAAGRALLDDADASAQRTTLGLVIGTNVQAFDADLTTLATAFTTASASGAASLKFAEDTDNGSNTVTLQGPASTADVTLTLPAATDTLVGKATTDTFTNKTFDADGAGNSITNIENADIKAAAAIALNKLAATTASKALVSDSSGFVSAATTTAAEIEFVNGVTSAIQTQLNGKQASDAELSAIAGLTSAADKLPYFTGSGTAALADLSSAMRTFLTTSSSANLAALLTDETGSGANVHATSPTLVTPTLGVAAATSINFGQDPLDYYEEGTWTPSFTAATVGDLSVSVSVATGYYTRVGRAVIAHFRIVCTPTYTTASGAIRIDGMPFAVAAVLNNNQAVNPIIHGSGFAYSAGKTYANANPIANQTYMQIVATGNASTVTTQTLASSAPSDTAQTLIGSVFYHV